MSQRLPSLPNLGHLKKQAKDVLRVSRHRNPLCRLADAQHALARGYGFPSWPKLKLHVESVRQQPRAEAPSVARAQKDPTPDDADDQSNASAQFRHSRSSHPIVGTWVARPAAASEDHSRAPIGDVVVEFELAGDVVTLTQVAVDLAGHQSATKMAITVDGHDHPIQFGHELVLQARWTGVRTLETIVKDGEKVVGKGTYEVSADGLSLVVSTTEQFVVFERV